MQSIEAKRALEVNKMSELVSQVEAIKVEVEHLAKEVEGNFSIYLYNLAAFLSIDFLFVYNYTSCLFTFQVRN